MKISTQKPSRNMKRGVHMKWFRSLSDPLKAAVITGLLAIVAALVGGLTTGIFTLASKTSNNIANSPIVTSASSPSPEANQTSIPSPTATTPPAPALVQKNFYVQSSDTITNTVSFPSSVTAGNLIIVAITHFLGVVSSVEDNQGNIYTQVTAPQHANASKDYVELYYAKNVKGGATTITVTFSVLGGDVGIYEYAGLNKTSPLDQVVSNAGSGQSPNGGTLSATTDNELYFVVGVDDNGDNIAPSAGNGYTLEDLEDDSTHHERFYSEDRISAHGSYQTNFSISSQSSPTVWAVIGASFKPA
jgi:hypothetical protein